MHRLKIKKWKKMKLQRNVKQKVESLYRQRDFELETLEKTKLLY